MLGIVLAFKNEQARRFVFVFFFYFYFNPLTNNSCEIQLIQGVVQMHLLETNVVCREKG